MKKVVTNYFWLILLVFGCSRIEQASEAAINKKNIDSFLFGKKVDYYWVNKNNPEKTVTFSVSFIDTNYCFIYYLNERVNPQRMVPYKLMGKWEANENKKSIEINIDCQLHSFDLKLSMIDPNRCKLETNLKEIPDKIDGRITDISVSKVVYVENKKNIEGVWRGIYLDNMDSIKLIVNKEQIEIENGKNDQIGMTKWNLSFDNNYLILPEKEVILLISSNQMGFPLKRIEDRMYLTMISYSDSIYHQFKIIKDQLH